MRYYWLKLKTDFFRDLRVKKLRQGPNGAALTLLYQELLLSALPNGGVLPLLGMDSPAAELAMLVDAPEEDCAARLDYLSAHGMLQRTAAGGLYLPMLEDGGDSEGWYDLYLGLNGYTDTHMDTSIMAVVNSLLFVREELRRQGRPEGELVGLIRKVLDAPPARGGRRDREAR